MQRLQIHIYIYIYIHVCIYIYIFQHQKQLSQFIPFSHSKLIENVKKYQNVKLTGMDNKLANIRGLDLSDEGVIIHKCFYIGVVLVMIVVILIS